ncbi:MAG: autotransporter outer membrane beta-barrel domain-containing protein [Verrucomicrobiota bacterium]
MKKQFLLSVFASITFAGVSYAQFNTSDINGYIGGFYIGDQALNQATAFTQSQIRTGSGVSAEVAYSDYEASEDEGRRFKGDVTTGSGSIGYVHDFDFLSVGIGLSGTSGELDAEGTDINPNVTLESEADGWLITLGAGKTWEKFSLVLTGTAGELSADTDREAVVGAATKTADYDLSLFQVEFSALYELITNETFSLSALAKLGYTSLEADGFTESAAIDAVEIDDFEDDRTYGVIGLEGALLSLGSFIPYASVSVWQDFGDDEVELSGFDPASNEFSTEIPDAVETAILGKVGFDYEIGEDWLVGASVGFFSGDDVDGFDASLGATFRF